MRSFVLVLWVAAAAHPSTAARWQSAGPWGGSATAIAVDPADANHLLAGARSSLLFKSADGGGHWTRLPFPRHFLGTVSSLLIDPANSRHYIAALSLPRSPYAGVWHSADGGANWDQSAGTAGIAAEALAVWRRDPARIVAGTRDGVWLSEDGARTFRRISPPWNHELRGVTAIAIDPRDANVIYAGTTHLPWKTSDGGATWKSVHTGMLDDSDVFSIFIDPAAPERVFASACSGIYRSESAGESWTKFGGIPGTHRRTHVIRLHPTARQTIFAGTTLGLLQSTDGGRSFKTLNRLHILSMAFDPQNPDRFYLATEKTGLFRTDDGGKTLKQINDGFVHRRALDWSGSDGVVYLNVVQDGSAGGVFRSTDLGRTWSQTTAANLALAEQLTSITTCPGQPNLVYAGGTGRLVRSDDGGKTFKLLKLPGPLNGLTCVSGSPAGRPVLLAATSNGPFRSTDLGATWLAAKLTTAAIRHDAQGFYTSPNARGRLVVRTTQTLYLSEDAGISWRALNNLFPVSSIYDFAMMGGPGTAMLAATPQGLYLSEDNGRTWSRRRGGLEEGTVSSLVVRPGRPREVFATQFGTLYGSRDAGRSWAVEPG